MSSKRKNPPRSTRQRLLNVSPVSNKRKRLVTEEEEDNQVEVDPPSVAPSTSNNLKRRIPEEDDDGHRNDPLIIASHETDEEKFVGVHLRDFEPKSSKDLVVSSQKLNELKSWFRQQFGSEDGGAQEAVASTSTAAATAVPTGSTPFLLLNGPSGTGKTASMQILCREFSVELIELSTASIFKENNLLTKDVGDLEISRDMRYKERLRDFADDDEDIEGIRNIDVRQRFKTLRPLQEESQQNRFHRFLADLHHYRKTVFDRISKSGKKSSAAPRKLLLIEDIPQIFQMHPEKLHIELLNTYEQFGPRTVPVVFIISDLTSTTSGFGASNAEFKLLPKWLQTKLNLQVITFKPVTEAAMKRALTRANKAHLKEQLSAEAIEEVVAASSGDIRNALNYLVFRHSLQSTPPSSTTSTSSNKKVRGNSKKSSGSSSKTNGLNGTAAAAAIESGREDQLTLTHAIGKIMYAKRTTEADPAAVEYLRRTFATSSKRPPNSDDYQKSVLRNVLQEGRPEAIAERTNASADTLLEWSHENFADFVNTASDGVALAQAVDCLEVLSTADATLREGGFESRPTMEAIRTSYVIRGQMFSLNRDASAYQQTLAELEDHHQRGDQRRKSGSRQQQANSREGTTFKRNTFNFRPLRGPKFWEQHRATVANLSQLVALKEADLYRGARLEADKNLVMDILPAVGAISSVRRRLATLDGGLRSFVAEMANFGGGGGGGYNRQPRLPEDQGAAGSSGFIEPSSTQQYNRSNLPLSLQRQSPFLKLGDSSDDDEDGGCGQGLVIEPDSD